MISLLIEIQREPVAPFSMSTLFSSLRHSNTPTPTTRYARRSSAEAEMTDDSPYSPTQLLATLMSENDDDGSGTISRSAFREALDRAFSTLNLQPIEENDIRRLMDHFDRNGRPSYVDFVKVLKSEAGSPKKYGNKGQGSGAPLYSRLQNAMMERRLDSLMVKEVRKGVERSVINNLQYAKL